MWWKRNSASADRAVVSDTRKLKTMVNDLQHMKQELLQEEMPKEMHTFDDYERVKQQLNDQLQTLRKDITRLNELRQSKGPAALIIQLHTENTHAIKESLVMFTQLKEIVAKDEKKTGKKRLDDRELMDRRHYLNLLGEEIKILTQDNSGVKIGMTLQDLAIQSRRDKRRAKDIEARNARKGRHGSSTGKELNLDDAHVIEIHPQSDEDQAFYAKVEENNKVQDEILDQISQALDDLKEQADTANKLLTVQKGIMDEIDTKIVDTTKQFDTANKRLKNILKESGGVTRWCFMIIGGVILLSLVGFMIFIM